MKNKRNAVRMSSLAVVGCMLLLAACASPVPVKVIPFAGQSLYPPRDPASVTVLQDDPVRPHKALGHVIVEPVHTLSIEETEKILRDTAAKMGADAVVVIANAAMQAGANPLHMYGGHLINAVAIKYKE